MANPKVLTPILNEGEMRHTVPLYCYKSFFVDGWQLFIRSNLFKPPLRVLTFSTLTHLQFTNLTADLLWEGGTLAFMLISTEAVHCVGSAGLGEGIWWTVKRTDSVSTYLSLNSPFWFALLQCKVALLLESYFEVNSIFWFMLLILLWYTVAAWRAVRGHTSLTI